MIAGPVGVKEEEHAMDQGIVLSAFSPSPTDPPQSPSPIRMRSRTRGLECATSAVPLPPLQEEIPASSPLTTISDLGPSPTKSTSTHTDKVMEQYF